MKKKEGIATDAIRLSVRKVVEHVMRGGDIDSRFADPSSMLEGMRIHKKLQREMGADYRAEVSLQTELLLAGIPAVLYGRADGVITQEDGSFVIDEIKTTSLPLERFYDQRELHLAQAKCYAVMLMRQTQTPPDEITLQLTYYQTETREIARHRFAYSAAELEAFFEDLMERYALWLRLERDWKELRTRTIKETEFPFPQYRKGQRELAVAAYRTVAARKKLYVQAPTGIGKTISAVFPAVKAIGEDKAEKIFYLTAKTVTRSVAEEAVRMMTEKGLRFKSVTLRAKDKICFLEERACNPDSCEYAKGHFDRVNDALYALITENDIITPDTVTQYAKKRRVCPHELALDATLWCDMVVGDYNHVFDPAAYLHRFFGGDEPAGDYVFLIDEAHNLADRVRDMYTAAVKKSTYNGLKRRLKDKNAAAVKLRKSITNISKHLSAQAADTVSRNVAPEQESAPKFPEPRISFDLDSDLLELVRQFTAACEEWFELERHNAHELLNDVLELYFEASAYIGVGEMYDEHYVSITEFFKSDAAATLFCLDPSAIIREKLGKARASVLFSATLTPLHYHREILGGADGDYMLALPSPFDPLNLTLLAHTGISTKYADREKSVTPIAETVYDAVSRRPGNYMVFFPSYEYMRRVYAEFCERYPGITTILQDNSMDEDARARFLERFSAENTETLLGFCVLGGIFSEGIDLKGERLYGAVVVGVGLPKLSLRQNLIKDYFNRKNGQGYDYAYVFPGMNKVLQAAGRVIRGEDDKGLVALIDTRFAAAKYREMYPEHWNHVKFIK
ncbi:MAG: PD-(D/E)XK nuclease family protein [Oscillospiraceae bacterium]|nr:PD-(D/E)XK nuclease family protein [Oscillospiraceae bacterium]